MLTCAHTIQWITFSAYFLLCANHISNTGLVLERTRLVSTPEFLMLLEARLGVSPGLLNPVTRFTERVDSWPISGVSFEQEKGCKGRKGWKMALTKIGNHQPQNTYQTNVHRESNFLTIAVYSLHHILIHPLANLTCQSFWKGGGKMLFSQLDRDMDN